MAYKMNGHTLPGINQRSEEKDDKFLKDQNPTVTATPKTEEEKIKFMNEEDHQSVPTITDFIGQGVHVKHGKIAAKKTAAEKKRSRDANKQERIEDAQGK